MVRLLCVGLCWLFLSGVLVTCAPRTSPSRAVFVRGKASIIGGKPDLRHPAVGALTLWDSFTCSGTLIASRVVLTAAHCVDYARALLLVNPDTSWSDLKFRIEVPSSQDPKGYVVHSYAFLPERAIVHPQWNTWGGAYPYDIAIIVLAEKVPANIATPLPVNSTKLGTDIVGKKALLLGYGNIKTIPLLVSPDRKHGAEMPIVKLDTSFLLLGSNQSEATLCYGDSGGPALLEVGGELRVVSVNSHLAGLADQIPGSGGTFSCTGGTNAVRTDIHQEFLQPLLARYGDGGGVTCKQNSDCGFCGECNDKKQCTPKALPFVKTTCQPCSSHADCDVGVCLLLAGGFRCVQPCAFSECCPEGSVCTPYPIGSETRICLPQGNACPDVACQTDAACGKAGVCEQGVCRVRKSQRSKRLCHPCKSASDCDAPGAICYGPAGQGRCLQPCEEGALCPEGFVCRSLYAGLPRQCVPVQRHCRIPCRNNTECSTGWTCTNGFCKTSTAAGEGELCHDRPCENPLWCVSTRAGKRCLRACGVSRGLPGSPCDVGDTCQDGATCYRATQEISTCLHTCKTNDDCAAHGGKRCFRGLCMCDSEPDCAAGYQCNKITGMLGACAPAQQQVLCAKPQVCATSYRRAAYCSPPASTGVQSIGEVCDEMNPCAPGLYCLELEGGGLCFESCEGNSSCRMGGSCVSVRGGGQVCMCSGQDCPQGRACVALYFRRRGLCRVVDSQECLSPSECPPGYTCTNKKCQPLQTEPAPERTLEPPASETASERLNTAEVSQEQLTDRREQTADAGTLPEQTLPPPDRGCGCSTGLARSGSPWLFGLLVLLGLLALRLRFTMRRHKAQ